MSDYKKELVEVNRAIREAGKQVLALYKEGAKVEVKADRTPVTEADLASQECLLNHLSHFDYGILSEEYLEDQTRLEKDRVWVIDPLDGTNDFIHETGEFTVMVGLVDKGEAVLGAVYQPTTDKLYFAVKGKGAFVQIANLNPSPLKVSTVSEASDARLLVSRNHFIKPEQRCADRLNIQHRTEVGSAGLKICMIAENKGDLYFSTPPKTGEWDVCAADVILTEAGGQLTDMNGKPMTYNRTNHVNQNGFVASNGKLHEELIRGWSSN